MRQYIGIVRDHSGSMGNLTTKAKQDFNEIADEMKSSFGNMTSKLTVVKCGFRSYNGGTSNVTEYTGVPLNDVQELTTYVANGSSTPLYDAVGTMMQLLQSEKDKDDRASWGGGSSDPDFAFLIIAITDGEENASKLWYASKLASEIRRLQATDRWTIVFRVPPRHKTSLVNRLGIHEGNVVEWEQTEQGLAASTYQTTSAIKSYGTMRSSGATSTDRFYTNVTQLSNTEIKHNLVDVTNRVCAYQVPRNCMGKEIRPFVEENLGLQYVVGSAYYQLSKTETLQPQKAILVRNDDGKYYAGASARQLLNFPSDRAIKIIPGNLGGRKVFIQSTSVNRHLMGETELVIYR